MDNQQGPTVEHMELCSVFVAAWMGWDEGEDTCVCTAESLHYSLESSTALLISCAPLQTKKFS